MSDKSSLACIGRFATCCWHRAAKPTPAIDPISPPTNRPMNANPTAIIYVATTVPRVFPSADSRHCLWLRRDFDVILWACTNHSGNGSRHPARAKDSQLQHRPLACSGACDGYSLSVVSRRSRQVDCSVNPLHNSVYVLAIRHVSKLVSFQRLRFLCSVAARPKKASARYDLDENMVVGFSRRVKNPC
ncbi:hypothetical protein Poly41_33840 [Novipirellula artificiosorum]|uniref:Uncharacterized protein n=1 Tax=Novipirellula artificiosorum TaxID=2528016 RepID=A0A5C6DM53_9BACT|nr:hypothetical protein Poly41_33840 [Novipirellula artificiosorum]